VTPTPYAPQRGRRGSSSSAAIARLGCTNAAAYTTKKDELPNAACGDARAMSTTAAPQLRRANALANAEEHASIHRKPHGLEQRRSLHQTRRKIVGAGGTKTTHHSAPPGTKWLDEERPGRGCPGSPLGACGLVGRSERHEATPWCHRHDIERWHVRVQHERGPVARSGFPVRSALAHGPILRCVVHSSGPGIQSPASWTRCTENSSTPAVTRGPSRETYGSMVDSKQPTGSPPSSPKR
jgi:hypothetical protein